MPFAGLLLLGRRARQFKSIQHAPLIVSNTPAAPRCNASTTRTQAVRADEDDTHNKSPLKRPVNSHARLPIQLQHSHESLEEQSRRLFLSKRGLNDAHLEHWCQILSTPDSLHAAQLLTRGPDGPPLVYRMLLDREYLRPEALRLLLADLERWHSLGHDPKHPDPNFVRVSEVFHLFERLVHHCLREWPEALESLATFLTRSLGLAQCRLLLPQLASHFNHAMSLISQTSTASPFKNMVHQEAAQAIVLRHMAAHSPALVINREGYRAVARVQLASAKIPTEQEWARLKSPSWPPWKEDRTGMDARIGLEYGISRAHHILNRMQEAGYPLQAWERVAMVYAGWDTDGSPTIQKRQILPLNVAKAYKYHLWIARIRTTRTAQQAWACFLAYQDEGLPPNAQLYRAMFEVLFEERKRLRFSPDRIGHESDSTTKPLYPGDTREIGSPPTSAHQLTYIRTEIPSIQQLFDQMRQERVKPVDATLVLLLDSAENLAEGIAYLLTAFDKYQDAVSALFSSLVDQQALSHLPDAIFAAYIRLLCRFPHSPLEDGPSGRWFYHGEIFHFRLSQPLARAIHLLVEQKRQYRPAWNCVLENLARKEAPALPSAWRDLNVKNHDSLKAETQAYDKIFAFRLAHRFVKSMKEVDLTLDHDALRQLCIIVEHAATAGHGIFMQYGFKPEDAAKNIDARSINIATTLFKEASPFIASSFHDLVHGEAPKDNETNSASTDTESEDDADSLDSYLTTFHPNPADTNINHDPNLSLPRLLTPPNPALLHAYIRALGLLNHTPALLSLASFMTHYHVELNARCALDHNGAVMMRRALTALRVFLEGRWEANSEAMGRSASEEEIEGVRRLLESVDGWDWPSDEEVAVYLERGRLVGMDAY